MKKQHNNLVKEHFDEIRRLYKIFESERRIILYDVEAGKILPLPYKGFKSILIEKESQLLLEEEYLYAQKNDRILIVVSDSKYQTIGACSIDKNSHQKCIPNLRTIY